MTEPFGSGQVGDTIGQPNPAGEKLILRSTEDVDVSVDVDITGDVSGSPDSDTITLDAANGKIEQETTKSFETLSQFVAAAPLTGDLVVYGQGFAAQGQMVINSVPSSGESFRLTLFGLTTFEYTYRSPGRVSITNTDAAGITQADYFTVTMNGVYVVQFVFDKDGAGTGFPSPPGMGQQIIVSIVTGNTMQDVAAQIQSAAAGVSNPYEVAATGGFGDPVFLTRLDFGTIAIADGAGGGATGFPLSVISAGTAKAAFQIRTGWDAAGSELNTTSVALYTADAIGLDGLFNLYEYSDSTTEHAYVNAVAVDDSVTFTDKIKTNRSLGWDFQQTSGSSFFITPLVGGVNGATIAVIPAGSTTLYDGFQLESPNLLDATLPALLTPQCDAINIGSSDWELHIKIASADGIDFQLQWTDDPENLAWATCTETASPVHVNNQDPDDPYILQITSVRPEYVRLVITGNTNVTAIALDARVNYKT